MADEHHQSLAPGDAGVEQVPLQHRVVLGQNGNHDGGIFGALAFVNGRGVGRHQRVEFAKAINDSAPIEAGGEFAVVWIDIVDVADVTVIDFLVVVILDLHDLVAGREGPAKAFDLSLASRVQRFLQFDIERSGTDAATVHRTKHLDVADRIETEALGDSGLHQLYDPLHCGFRIVSLHKIKVALAFGLREVRDRTLIDLVGGGDDPALCGLSKYLGETHDCDGA